MRAVDKYVIVEHPMYEPRCYIGTVVAFSAKYATPLNPFLINHFIIDSVGDVLAELWETCLIDDRLLCRGL